MKSKFRILPVVVLIILTSSCTTVVQMQRTYPPEKTLQPDSVRFVFVNFYDYRIPESIKDKYEIAYAVAVRGYIDGLGKTVLMDPKESFAVGDTLRSGFTVSSMQLPEFTDTVRAICSVHGADMLIALDSINLVMDWDVNLEEDDEGDKMLVKDFYLYANNYMTLYTSDGEVIDRCAGEKSTYVKSKYTIFGMIGGPTIAKARETVRLLSHEAARDCIGKFYPFTETYTETLYKGGPLNKINELIMAGHYEEAAERLNALVNSADKDLAKKASSNLEIVKRIQANRRETEQIMQDFTR
jgi:hypothetical protein